MSIDYKNMLLGINYLFEHNNIIIYKITNLDNDKVLVPRASTKLKS